MPPIARTRARPSGRSTGTRKSSAVKLRPTFIVWVMKSGQR